MGRNEGILALFPFLVTGSLPMAVMRELRRRGEDVTVARYLPKATGYTMDTADDLASENRLIDMYDHLGSSGVVALENICADRSVGMVVQVGSPWAYAQLSHLKERRPDLKLVDMLYNTGPHFHSFGIYGPIFDAVLVESRPMLELLAGGAHGAAVHQVESGVDLARFAPSGRAAEPPSGDLILGYFGRLSPEKNPLGFIALAEDVHRALPWMRFAIYGQGPQEAEVKARLFQSPARDVIHLGGFVDHPTTAYGQIDILSVPSILDGRPAAVMEASACGVPVIGAPVGGIPELIEDGRNGHVVRVQDASRIIELLTNWRSDTSAFAEMRRKAHEVANTRFDRDRMMDRYHTVLTGILKSTARPLGVCAA
jgi:glycosyltransferase involved in cell wall biosynthesis